MDTKEQITKASKFSLCCLATFPSIVSIVGGIFQASPAVQQRWRPN